MKLQYCFVILLSLGSFLPVHGMFGWSLFGSDDEEVKEDKSGESKKSELQKKIEDLPVNENLKKVLEGSDIDESISYLWTLVEDNKPAMKKKFEQEIGDIPGVGGIASFATRALSGVGLDIPQKMVDGMVEKRNGIRAAFRWANGEEKKKQNPINVFEELSKINEKEKSDLVKGATRCFLMKIDLCLCENQEKLTEVFEKESSFVLKPFVPGIIKSAIKKSSDWHNDFIAMAQNSLCKTEDDKE